MPSFSTLNRELAWPRWAKEALKLRCLCRHPAPWAQHGAFWLLKWDESTPWGDLFTMKLHLPLQIKQLETFCSSGLSMKSNMAKGDGTVQTAV